LLCAHRLGRVDCTMSCIYGIPESNHDIRLAGEPLSLPLAVMAHQGHEIIRKLISPHTRSSAYAQASLGRYMEGEVSTFRGLLISRPFRQYLSSTTNPIPREIFLIVAFFRNSSLARLRVCYVGHISFCSITEALSASLPWPIRLPQSFLCPKLSPKHLESPLLLSLQRLIDIAVPPLQ